MELLLLVSLIVLGLGMLAAVLSVRERPRGLRSRKALRRDAVLWASDVLKGA